jgi:hypothetical protein
MNEQRSKIPIATLADPEQDRLISRRVLAWHQPDTGGKVPTIMELLAITAVAICGPMPSMAPSRRQASLAA